MAQMLNHSEDHMVHGLFPKKVTDAVLSNHEKHSMLLILKPLTRRSSRDLRAE